MFLARQTLFSRPARRHFLGAAIDGGAGVLVLSWPCFKKGSVTYREISCSFALRKVSGTSRQRRDIMCEAI
jgi:hypothetical protein